ncbi:MAG: inositol monophosphatase family protein [Chloroflexota bacterium]
MSELPVPIEQLVEVAELAARTACEVATSRLTAKRDVNFKGYRDIVTDADIAAQASIAATIRNHFPDHGFLTEEDDLTLPTTGPVIWIIDPVDGTTNYSRQLPVFCTSIAAAIQSPDGVPQLVAAAIYDPLRDEMFSSGKGLGSRLNDRPIQVSAISSLADAAFGIDFGNSDEVRHSTFEAARQLANEVNTVRAFGSAALGLAWVAAGRLDIYYNAALKPWDIAAGQLIIEEAGGRLSIPGSASWKMDTHDYPVLSSNNSLHETLLVTFQP